MKENVLAAEVVSTGQKSAFTAEWNDVNPCFSAIESSCEVLSKEPLRLFLVMVFIVIPRTRKSSRKTGQGRSLLFRNTLTRNQIRPFLALSNYRNFAAVDKQLTRSAAGVVI